MDNNDIKPVSGQTQSDAQRPPLKTRLAQIKLTRWLRYGIVSALFIFWVVLMGNPWLLFLWIPITDIYITQFIPWDWWKKKKGPVHAIMTWVDAIVYALVLIYIIFAFVGQQYEIPSSSLEKSLLVGDRLWVDKTVYGPRVPQTPLHFPLAQHTMPFLNTKSYIDSPQLEYHRMPGRRSVERGDIVVFNYPQGDTVTLRIQNPDYYQICAELRKEGVSDPLAYIKKNPQMFGEVVVRPVDRRENYVKRAIGLPGEWLEIKNDTIFIDGKPIAEPENVQYNYIVPVNGPISAEKWHQLGVRAEDHGNAPQHNPVAGFSYYDVPLTKAMKAEIETWKEVIGPLQKESESGFYDLSGVFPLGADYDWTRTDIGPLWIPKRGSTLRLNERNYPLYERVIRTYEGNTLEKRNGKFYINGKETEYYTFKMDYYWMQGDNRDRSADSRYWGFVPEDHIVGQPVAVLISIDKEVGGLSGMRWNRILKNPNPDKSDAKWSDSK